MVETIGNPGTWFANLIRGAGSHAAAATGQLGAEEAVSPPVIRTITTQDISAALRAGWDDFTAFRTDVMVLVLLYPFMGLVMAWFAFDRALIPLLFPLVSGFALVGPVAAVGLYEMSRRREKGLEVGWSDAFGVLASPSFGPILVLGLYLLATFFVWLVVAHWIYTVTLGPQPPESAAAFMRAVLTPGPGWTMIIFGTLIGFFFAAIVLAVTIVSFPMLLDKRVGLPVAVATSLSVASRNKAVTALWGMVVAGGLVLGSLPILLGLIVVLPVLGHATWHLYRRAVEWPE